MRDAAPFRIAVTATASGLDIAAVRQREAVRRARRAQASHFATAQGFARLSLDGEIVVEPRKPMIDFDEVPVAHAARSIPAGGRSRRKQRWPGWSPRHLGEPKG